jgi:ABC-type lipoprotein export system ATPase subunit
MSTILSLERVTKSFPDAAGRDRRVLDAVSWALERPTSVAITGPSGTGKSTLLHLIAGIDVPTSGTVSLLGNDLARLPDAERARLRRDVIGFVFQFFHLLPHLTVEENVALPALIAGQRVGAVRERILDLLARVGLESRRRDLVGRLSGGEMQRVAVCRALLRRPRIILADEPTGNLDRQSGRAVLEEMLSLVDAEGATLVYVTHSEPLAQLAAEQWRLESGRLTCT